MLKILTLSSIIFDCTIIFYHSIVFDCTIVFGQSIIILRPKNNRLSTIVIFSQLNILSRKLHICIFFSNRLNLKTIVNWVPRKTQLLSETTEIYRCWKIKNDKSTRTWPWDERTETNFSMQRDFVLLQKLQYIWHFCKKIRCVQPKIKRQINFSWMNYTYLVYTHIYICTLIKFIIFLFRPSFYVPWTYPWIHLLIAPMQVIWSKRFQTNNKKVEF